MNDWQRTTQNRRMADDEGKKRNGKSLEQGEEKNASCPELVCSTYPVCPYGAAARSRSRPARLKGGRFLAAEWGCPARGWEWSDANCAVNDRQEPQQD